MVGGDCTTTVTAKPAGLKTGALTVLVGVLAALAAGCGGEGGGAQQPPPARGVAEKADPGPITVYSGRERELIAPLIERYERRSGAKLEVRYGESPELAATLLEEGEEPSADVFFSQDAGSLGALQAERRLASLPEALLARVPPEFRSSAGTWVGTSGRARVIAYDRRELRPADLPRSILEFADPKWKGRIGWAPTNASLQAFVTALRITRGEEAASRWVEGIVANDAEEYENNVAIRDAIAAGEIDVGFINHYYVAQAVAEEGDDYPVGVYFPPGGDPGSLVNVAGAGLLAGAENQEGARAFIDFLLGREAQRYFAQKMKEYPLAAGVKSDPSLRPLSEIERPKVDLSDLADVKSTTRLLEDAGAL